MGINPYVIGAALLFFLLSYSGVYMKGRIDGRAVCDDRIAELMKASAVQAAAEAQRAATISASLEAANAKTEIKYRTIIKRVEKIVEKPVYRNQCFDADGVQLVNDALTGTLPVAGESPDAVLGTFHP